MATTPQLHEGQLTVSQAMASRPAYDPNDFRHAEPDAKLNRAIGYFEQYLDVNHAIRQEKRLKEWPLKWTSALIEIDNREWLDLYPELVDDQAIRCIDAVGQDDRCPGAAIRHDRHLDDGVLAGIGHIQDRLVSVEIQAIGGKGRIVAGRQQIMCQPGLGRTAGDLSLDRHWYG